MTRFDCSQIVLDFWCHAYVGATSLFVADGGFVSDPRDDNVQTLEPEVAILYPGIGRFPLLGVPSYFAFALNRPDALVNFVSISTPSYAGSQPAENFAVVQRYNCGASNIAGPYTCKDNYYHITVRELVNISIG